MSDNLKEFLLDVLLILFICSFFLWSFFLVTHEPSYDKIIKSCEKTGMFYVNENLIIKRKVLK